MGVGVEGNGTTCPRSSVMARPSVLGLRLTPVWQSGGAPPPSRAPTLDVNADGVSGGGH